MLKTLTDEQRHDIEGLCTHIEGHLFALRTHLGNHGAESVTEVHEQADEIEGWGTAIKDVCTGKDAG